MQILQSFQPRANRAGVQKAKRHSLKVDMTPMVDLGFLLITFFVITAELSKPTMTDIVMPKDGIGMPVAESKVMTILMADNRLAYYEGSWEDALRLRKIREISGSKFDELRRTIQDKKRRVRESNLSGEHPLTILIKPGKETNYKTVVDVLDEMVINVIGTYAIVDQTVGEKAWLTGNQD